MAYTVTKLITNAWYLSGIVSRGIEVVSGDQIADGQDLLNALLSFKTSDGGLIPYFQSFTFNLVPGQETYFIPNLVADETTTFNFASVRYSMLKLDRKRYQGSARINNVESLPYSYFYERTLNGTNLNVYFLPDQAYPVTIWGKFALTDPTLNQDLLLIYDAFYIEYLRYGLAEMMCCEYNVEFLQQCVNKLRAYENRLREVSPYDIVMTKQSTLLVEPGINYADVNLGRGWRP